MGTLSANQLGSLKPGDVVCLDRQIDELADVHIGNRACFKGSLCASRSRAAVRIVKRISEKNQDGPADRHEAKPK
jgi:flagellar motor switch protein FliM